MRQCKIAILGFLLLFLMFFALAPQISFASLSPEERLQKADKELAKAQQPEVSYEDILKTVQTVRRDLGGFIRAEPENNLSRDLLSGRRLIAHQSWQSLEDIEKRLDDLILAQSNPVQAVELMIEKTEEDLHQTYLKRDFSILMFERGKHKRYKEILAEFTESNAELDAQQRNYLLKNIAFYHAKNQDITAFQTAVDEMSPTRVEDQLVTYLEGMKYVDQKHYRKLLKKAENILASAYKSQIKKRITYELQIAAAYWQLGDPSKLQKMLKEYADEVSRHPRTRDHAWGAMYSSFANGWCEPGIAILDQTREQVFHGANSFSRMALHAFENCEQKVSQDKLSQWTAHSISEAPKKYHYRESILFLSKINAMNALKLVASKTDDLFRKSEVNAVMAEMLFSNNQVDEGNAALLDAKDSYDLARKSSSTSKNIKRSSRALAAMAKAYLIKDDRSKAYELLGVISDAYVLRKAVEEIAINYANHNKTKDLYDVLEYLPPLNPTPGVFSDAEGALENIAEQLIEKGQNDAALEVALKTQSPGHIGRFFVSLLRSKNDDLPDLVANARYQKFLHTLAPGRSLWVLPASQDMVMTAKKCMDHVHNASIQSSAVVTNKAIETCKRSFTLAKQENQTDYQVVSTLGFCELYLLNRKKSSSRSGSELRNYFQYAIDLADKMQFSNKWINDALVARLLFLQVHYDASTYDRFMSKLYDRYIQLSLPRGVVWASIASMVDYDGSREYDWPQILDDSQRVLTALPDSETRTRLLINVHIRKADVVKKQQPVQAFDDLMAAHRLSTSSYPKRLAYIQLLIANLLDDQVRPLIKERLIEILSLVKTTRETEYLDRIIRQLSFVAINDCSFVQMLFDKERELNPKAVTEVVPLLYLHMLYGQTQQVGMDIERIYCLNSDQLALIDREKLLEVLSKVAPKDKRTNAEIYRKITTLEKRLSTKERSD